MSTNHRSRYGSLAPVHRTCALCGQPKTIYPLNEEHRRAHLDTQLAFVCDDCAGQVRMEVEAAGSRIVNPKISA